MVCIYCSGKTFVTNSRKNVRTNAVWRRRSCVSCEAQFTSFESIDLAQSLLVRSSSGTFSAFQRDRLYIDVYESFKHRPNAVTEAFEVVQTIINKIIASLPAEPTRGTIDITKVSEITHKTLQKFDTVAATHYKAFFVK